MIVQKFGGTSMEDAAAIGRVIAIIETHRERSPLVVVSAAAGVTTALLQMIDSASAGNSEEALSTIAELQKRHMDIARNLLPEPTIREFSAALAIDCASLRAIVKRTALNRFAPLQARDEVAAQGELWSSRLLTLALQARGIDSWWTDAREVLKTDDSFADANPLLMETNALVVRVLGARLRRHGIIVTQGFIGSTSDGLTTTIGRGGSDYSATLFGAALDAEEIQIWSDTDGILSADPRVVPDAQSLTHIFFEEAAELAHYGAKVLHPKTSLPAVENEIPVRVLNSRNARHPGTLITYSEPERDGIVVSVSSREGLVLIRSNCRSHLATLQELTARFARQTFEGLEYFAQSQLGFVAIEAGESLSKFPFSNEEVRITPCTLICVVGINIGKHCTIESRSKQTLREAEIPVLLSFPSVSEHALLLAVPESLGHEAVKALHQQFCGSGSRLPATSCSNEPELRRQCNEAAPTCLGSEPSGQKGTKNR